MRKRKEAIVGTGIAVLLVLGAAACGGGSSTSTEASSVPAMPASTAGAVEESTEPVGESAATVEESAAPALPEEEVDEAADAAVPPKTFKGSGDKIIKYKSGPFIATMTHRGGGNFAVWSLDGGKQETDLLVNEIGNYSGTTLAPEDEYFGLKVEADGAWTVEVQPFDQAPVTSGTVKGRGDSVLIWQGEPETIAVIKHKGESNFAVWFYDEDGRDLLVNEIGNYSGEQFIGPGLLQIEADGTWSVTPE